MSTPDELRELVEAYLAELALTPELDGLEESMRYALAGGGKRVRPVLCLATAEAAGAEAEAALPAAAALELVHNFSLVHDDLPALDNDELRRGRPSTWAAFGEAVAVLAGDALLAEAFRLALSYPTPAVARELAQATLGMIGGQYLDITRSAATDLAALHRLKTGACSPRRSRARSGWRRCPSASRRRGAPSRTSSACSSRSWTTSSTRTATVLEHGADGARAARRRGRRAGALGGAPGRDPGADTPVLAEHRRALDGPS